jgi:Flp pilus assembly protein TadD
MGLTTELLERAAFGRAQPGFTERTTLRLRESGLSAHLELLFGVACLQKNRPGEASRHFKEAWELLPGNPVLANNHAVMLGAGPGDADRAAALAIIEGVLASHPEVPTFLDTKGQILLALRRPEEAALILEAALKQAPAPATHLALAEAYSRLGRTDLADLHRNLAARK